MAKIYLSELKELIDKKIISIPGVKIQRRLFIERDVFFQSNPMLAVNRKPLLDYLIAEGFDIAAQHIRNLSATSPYDIYQSTNDNPVTREVVDKIVLLPCYPDYPKEMLLIFVRILKILSLICNFPLIDLLK